MEFVVRENSGAMIGEYIFSVLEKETRFPVGMAKTEEEANEIKARVEAEGPTPEQLAKIEEIRASR